MDKLKQHALLVGLNKYPSIGDLKGPGNDMAAMENWLINDLSVPRKNIKKFRDVPAEYLKPEVGDFEAWVRKLERKAKAANGPFPYGERLYVYFAGHGYQSGETAQPALILPGSQIEGFWNALPMVPLREGLKLRAYFGEIILLFDSCRSRRPYYREATWKDSPKTSPNSTSVRTYSVFASKSGMVAKEVEFAEAKWNGVVTQAFLAGVQGYAADTKGVVYAHTLKAFLIAAVKDRLGVEYEPEVDDPSTDEEPWALFEAVQKLPRIVIDPKVTKTGSMQLTKLQDGSTQAIDLAVGVQVFEVPRGKYLLKFPGGAEQKVMAVWEEKVVEV